MTRSTPGSLRPRRPRLTFGKLTAAAAVAWAMLIAVAPAAFADAAGPTDYRSEILAIEPAVSSIAVEVIGGDSFVRLVQLESVEVEVLGYRSEPYLRFDADGTVVENYRSPSTWQNEERYGTEDEFPSFVDYEAAPDWRVVSDDGTYAWHDHRAHWMNPNRPPGAEAGDQVLEAVIPLLVDGQPVAVTVGSWLLDDPSPLPIAFGAIVALPLAVLAVRGGRLPLASVGLAGAGAALVLGAVAWASVPAETEPERLLWLLPLVALIAILVVIAVRNRLATTVYLDGLAVVCGVTLVAWGITRFDALTRALIPSDVPGWIDRFGITAALVIGAAITVRGAYGLARPERLIDPS